MPTNWTGHASKLIALSLSVSLAGCNPATGKATALFQNVAAAEKWDQSSFLDQQFSDPKGVPKYVVREGQLYLLVQVTQPHRFTNNVVEMPGWSPSDVEALARSHPELRQYLKSKGWARTQQAPPRD